MTLPLARPGGWGAERKGSALSITFDNLGEAAEIEMGWWGDQPVGDHYTAHFIPELIAALDGAAATYFAEASNALIYPQQLRRWVDAGNKIGVHGWRHEVWETCSPERRTELLARSLAAYRELGIEPIGFRPPGGAISDVAIEELRAAGLLYVSALDVPGAARGDGMILLPFRWRDVDAYMLEEVLAFARVRDGLSEDVVSIAEWRELLSESLAEARRTNSHRVLIFHPQFLAKAPEKLAVVTEIVAEARDHDMWIAAADDVARWLARDGRLASPSIA